MSPYVRRNARLSATGLQGTACAAKPGETRERTRMAIDIDTARKVAKLARIRVEEADS
jgi:hypothetical protein